MRFAKPLLSTTCATAFLFATLITGVVSADLVAPEPEFETIDTESAAILAREPVTASSDVKHILIGWAELAPAYGGQMDPRGLARTREQADALAMQLLAQVRAGDPIEALMAQYSEDPGSAASGDSYNATPEAGLVEPFKALALRLTVGEVGLVMTQYGWHIIVRVS